MVDPINITNYNLNKNQLQEVLLFWILAAGKNGVTSAKCLDRLLTSWDIGASPFETIKYIHKKGNLALEMKNHGIGCFNNKAKSFLELVNSNIDLKTCTVEELESIRGIGPKTARCFLIHSRKNQPLAGLDRHILSFLRDKGHKIPTSTPSGKKYKEIENLFLSYAKKSGKTVADFDLAIWREYRNKK